MESVADGMREKEKQLLVPKLRFPGFQENWNIKQLDEIGETASGLNGKSGGDFGQGQPFVTYKQVFDCSVVDFSRCGKVYVAKNEKQNKLQFADILITMSSETPGDVGFASVVLEKISSPVYLNSFCFVFRPKSLFDFSPQFSQYLFHAPLYRNIIATLAQGSTRFNISKNGFLKIKLPIPEIAEQQKIADCLSSLDDLIETQSQKLELLKAHKKALMQQLFPARGGGTTSAAIPGISRPGAVEGKENG